MRNRLSSGRAGEAGSGTGAGSARAVCEATDDNWDTSGFLPGVTSSVLGPRCASRASTNAELPGLGRDWARLREAYHWLEEGQLAAALAFARRHAAGVLARIQEDHTLLLEEPRPEITLALPCGVPTGMPHTLELAHPSSKPCRSCSASPSWI